jgi:hypothetical protein
VVHHPEAAHEQGGDGQDHLVHQPGGQKTRNNLGAPFHHQGVEAHGAQVFEEIGQIDPAIIPRQHQDPGARGFQGLPALGVGPGVGGN